MEKPRQRFLRFEEVEGRILRGTALPYGQMAASRELGYERILAGAFGDVSRLDVTLNTMHDRKRVLARSDGGGLTFTDSDKALSVEAVLPQTRECDDCLEMIDKNIYRGLSIEYLPHKLRRGADGVVEVSAARLTGLAVVTRPAYAGAILHRDFEDLPSMIGGDYPARVFCRQRIRRPRIAGEIAYNVEVVTSARHKRSQIIRPGAFKRSLEEGMPVYLLAGLDYNLPLAGTEEGTLALHDTPEKLEFSAARLPRTAATSALLENGRKFEQSARPGMLRIEGKTSERASDKYEDFTVEIVDEAGLCEIGVFTRSNEGSKVRYPQRSGGRRRRR